MQSRLRQIEVSLGGGTLGVAATFLPTGESIFYNADTLFPTASVIKIAIVGELFLQAEAGQVDLDSAVTVTDETLVPGSGVLAMLSPNLTLPLRDLATLAITVSDNTASNLCLRAVGGPEAVNQRMSEAWEMGDTKIHRPIRFTPQPGDPPHTATGTPRDFLALLTRLHQADSISSSAADEVLRCMENVADTALLPRFLEVNSYARELNAAPTFTIRHKTGAVTGVRNDVGLIARGDDTLAVAVFTKDVPDSRWTVANTACEAVARVGESLCRRFFGK